jgi:NAD(P)-dependent dehydrogenase (short-subunit alcohol dehydrogenase family)
MSVFVEDLLEGKSAVVTGGGSGINLGIAERFAQAGARLTLIGRKQEKLDAACASIREAGGTAIGLSADVRSYDALASRMKEARDRHGEIDILVCGAAGNFPAPAAGMSANGFKSVVDIDLLGTFNACRAAFEHLRKPGASIVGITAPQSVLPTPFQSHVCAAKAGVDMVTKVLALEWAGLGIRVNAISPGPIDDTEGMRRLTPTPEAKAMVEKKIPLQRFGEKSDIAEVALFLVSPAARYITGAVIPCDGGQVLVGSSSMMDLFSL